MPAYVSRPAIELPPHKVTTEEICADITARHPGHPRLGAWLRTVRNVGVTTRYFTQALESPYVSGRTSLEERNRQAFADGVDLAAQAARHALDATRLAPSDIDCIVTSHTVGWALPHLDIHLIERLGLRPDVRRLAFGSLGCIGGAHALAMAADQVAARPASRVLVVVAEPLSTIYHHTDTSTEAMIYKGLFGDSGGACIVTGEPLGPGLRIDDSWHYHLPHSRDRYWGRLDADGFHFDSTRAALTAPADAMPALTTWLASQPDHQEPGFILAHAGGPAILNTITGHLGFDREDLRHSWDSLAETGNLGGISVLDVLRRTHDTPPADGDRGLMLAYGPGFTTSALTGTWTE
ncbi:type III polyketide synthase [Streptomyces sp. NPDC017529]|uniref:type III polyketide synthase n=1 Tax=Streptomyces sp. NPDC017529 TaxID=3365000 RepID=UPI00378E6A3D